MSTFVVKNLEHAKLLTDSFKLQLLEKFSGEPVTTKQVADAMGEKAPRLYRHVDAMVDAGFLRLVSEKPKRGTIERYYQTVASRFEVDPDLFAPSSGRSDEAFDIVRSLLRDVESDLLRLSDLDEQVIRETMLLPIVGRLSIRASKEEIAGIRNKLQDWMQDVQALVDAAEESEDSSDHVSYAGLMAFYPLIDESGQLAEEERAES